MSPRHSPRKALVFKSAEDFKPFRDRHVLTTTVACPTCAAAVGEACKTTEGRRASPPHRERRRLALRTEREGDAA